MRLPLCRPFRSSRLSNHQQRFVSQSRASNPSTTARPPASKPTSNNPPNRVVEDVQKQQGRIDRLLKRTPRFLHRHVSALRSAPITHVTAFLILHEITAIVPLLGLAGAFHYYHWLPTYFSEGTWVLAGVEKFGRYFKRKGWISDSEEEAAEKLAERGDTDKVERRSLDSGKWWDRGEGGVRLVVEFATAYAIVKALLVPRLIISAWAAPWFARLTVVPTVNMFKRLFGRGKVSSKGATS